MRKTIVVKTDDPEKKKFNLVVTGMVDKVVDISPRSVYLTGKPGETLETVVNITPAEKYPFSILELNQKVNTRIKATLVEPREDQEFWQIKIKSMSDKADDYYDVVTLKTDSQYKSILTIRVYAIFLEQKKQKS